jgi:hypothetical protein
MNIQIYKKIKIYLMLKFNHIPFSSMSVLTKDFHRMNLTILNYNLFYRLLGVGLDVVLIFYIYCLLLALVIVLCIFYILFNLIEESRIPKSNEPRKRSSYSSSFLFSNNIKIKNNIRKNNLIFSRGYSSYSNHPGKVKSLEDENFEEGELSSHYFFEDFENLGINLKVQPSGHINKLIGHMYEFENDNTILADAVNSLEPNTIYAAFFKVYHFEIGGSPEWRILNKQVLITNKSNPIDLWDQLNANLDLLEYSDDSNVREWVEKSKNEAGPDNTNNLTRLFITARPVSLDIKIVQEIGTKSVFMGEKRKKVKMPEGFGRNNVFTLANNNIPFFLAIQSLGRPIKKKIEIKYINEKIIGDLYKIKDKKFLINEKKIGQTLTRQFMLLNDNNKVMIGFKDVLNFNKSNVCIFYKRFIGTYHIDVNLNKIELIKLEKEIKTTFIKTAKPLKKLPDKEIITFDIECLISESLHIPFACSYFTQRKDSPIFKFFYLPDYDTPQDILNSALLEIITNFDGSTIYIHNLSRYDLAFLNEVLNKTFITKYKFKDEKVLSIKLKLKVKDEIHSIIIKDSILLLTKSLDNLCKAYKINSNDSKCNFPYLFPNVHNLNYCGKVPSFSNYTNLRIEEYNNLVAEYNSQNKP